jgi:hypothetical protein
MGGASMVGGKAVETRTGHEQLIDLRERNKLMLQRMIDSMSEVYFGIIFEVEHKECIFKEWGGDDRCTTWYSMDRNCQGTPTVRELWYGWIDHDSFFDEAMCFDTRKKAEKYFLAQMPDAKKFLDEFYGYAKPTGVFEIIELAPRFELTSIGSQLKDCSDAAKRLFD